jgi:hypothetical protein
VTAATAPVNAGQVDTAHEGQSSGAGRRASPVEREYVHARFDGIPVLVGPELAAQLRAIRQSREPGST